jgi:RNA polymerase sigma-70 factor (ECF subfamily)
MGVGGAGAAGAARAAGGNSDRVTEQIPVLRSVARRLCRNPSDADDLVQDALERALGSVHRLDATANLRGWIAVIVHNLHIDQCRRRARQGAQIPWEEAELPVVPAPESAAEPAWTALTVDDVRCAVRQLPAELREPYTRFAFEGHSYAEVAAALGIPKATVGTRLLRARSYLKRLLRATLPACS